MEATLEVVSKSQVEDLYLRYAECICDGALEQWPEFFSDQCLYKVISRANYDRGLPLAPIFSESRGALADRVLALRNTMVYAPRSVIHNVTGIRVTERTKSSVKSRSMISVYQTLLADGSSHLLLIGKTLDRLAFENGELKFEERIVVYDNELIDGALVFPI